ncbi:N-acetylmuramoyl-L-alanine amidase [Candidatus Albibeggiatoa sp. nov. BB20]|uniref:N-acetylmuramoyl-L-alanine amidase n=1 Tax=Candidatus Albibeggiatoa sp. nov. BB20 TaxID=3162723 RepID=UPI0033657C23
MRLLFGLLILFYSFAVQSIELNNIRFWQQNALTTRVILDLSNPASYNIFTLTNPYRLVLDLKKTHIINKVDHIPAQQPVLKNIRYAKRNKQDLRIVFDLKKPVRTTSYLVAPDQHGGHRLLLDIAILNKTLQQQSVTPTPKPIPKPVIKQPAPSQPKLLTKSKIIIAVDPGHGGIDPGATGKQKTKEKNVVLAVGKKLVRLINQQPGYKAILTRSNDKYLKLRRRIEIARQYQADLFISLHADALPDDQKAYGSSVYMLSQSGASSEAAQWLAQKENSADLIGGVSLSDKDDLLASVLLDLSQEGTLEASALVGQKILKSLGKVDRVHFKKLQRAAFMVLRSPDIPSVLVEMAFLSTPSEERKLNDPHYQNQLAQALSQGIQHYFAEYPPTGMN